MYKRLRDGLFAPNSIIDYIKDKIFMPFLQLLIYAILMVIPVVVSNLTFSHLDYNTKQEIAEIFTGETIKFKIEDSKLVNISGSDDYVYTHKITDALSVRVASTEENKLSNTYIIEFSEEGFKLKFAYLTLYQGKYSDYSELENLDLTKLESPNSGEWDKIFSVVDNYLKDYYRSNIVPSTIFGVARYYIFLLILTLIISTSFLFRFRNILKYSAMFKMSAYYTAPFVLGIVLSNLLSLSIFYIIGLILSVAYTFIGSSTIIKRLLNSDRK